MKELITKQAATLPVQLHFMKALGLKNNSNLPPKKTTHIYVEQFATYEYHPKPFFKVKYIPIMLRQLSADN